LENKIIAIAQRMMVALGVAFCIGAFYSKTYELYIAGSICIATGLAIYFYVREKAQSKAFLLKNGQLIQADITEIALNESIDVNGRSPFRIIAQWHDKTTNQIYIYKSANLWFDPKPFVSSEKIQVYVDPNNPSKHHMDISFLPKKAN
jgi:hypothetical protein